MAKKLEISRLQEITENFCGIYVCLCLITGKYYLGSAKNFFKRKSVHLFRLRKKNHDSPHFQNAWNLYSSENFIWYKIRDCKKENLKIVEQFYLDVFNPCNRKIGFNINPKASGGHGKISEETRKKLRISSTGRKYPNKIYQKGHPPTQGKKMSDETKAKIAAANKNKIRTPEMSEKAKIAAEIRAIETRNYYFVKIESNEILHFHMIKNIVNEFGGRKNSYCDIWHQHGGRKTHNGFRRASETEIQKYQKEKQNAEKI